MAFFKAALSHLSHKQIPVVETNVCLESWCNQSRIRPTQLVRKVEMCTALSSGNDAWGTPVDKTHYHTLLRVFLVPNSGDPGASEDVLLIERVLSTGGEYHSVTPIGDKFSTSGTLFHPDVHDRVCVISEGPSTALAHDLEVERTIEFGDGSWKPCLTLAHFAQILELVSRMTALICAGGDCKFQSRSFVFTCLAALAPSFPPPTLVREGSRGVGMKGEHGAGMVNDSMFELGAEAFLGQIPWLAQDPASVQALKLIRALKDEPRERAPARLYH